MTEVRTRLRNLTARQWTLLVASSYGVVGLLVSTILASWFFEVPIRDIPAGADGFGVAPLVVGAVAGAVLLSGITWWILVESPKTYTPFRAGVAGFLTGVLSHVVMWLFHGLWMVSPCSSSSSRYRSSDWSRG